MRRVMGTGRFPGGVRPARPGDLEEILSLVSGLGLPVAGVGENMGTFLVLESDGTCIGTVGLELYGRSALLRSLAVSPGWQGRGLGRELCRAALERAKELGVIEIILLTETAVGFFQKLGFGIITRIEAPEALRSSVEFTSSCPETATCMRLCFR